MSEIRVLWILSELAPLPGCWSDRLFGAGLFLAAEPDAFRSLSPELLAPRWVSLLGVVRPLLGFLRNTATAIAIAKNKQVNSIGAISSVIICAVLSFNL